MKRKKILVEKELGRFLYDLLKQNNFYCPSTLCLEHFFVDMNEIVLGTPPFPFVVKVRNEFGDRIIEMIVKKEGQIIIFWSKAKLKEEILILEQIKKR